ncbi:unnamed protein product [Arctogadus glacialis]
MFRSPSLPYSWEVLEGNQWMMLETTEEIEEDYCDPQNTYSYFSRDASYSHKYTGNASTVRSMFVSRVLVGHHTRGEAGYVRLPSKDGGDTHFYDSCADRILSPSIFVVFDRPQIYPEFLLTYKERREYDLDVDDFF